MRKFIFTVSSILTLGFLSPASVMATTPEQDVKAFQQYFIGKFPNVDKGAFKDGVYALDKDLREQWENSEEFPPYEDNIEMGEEMFNTPFANGQSYADCLPKGGKGIRQMYPYFDTKEGTIKTLEGEINACRVKNGEKPLKYKKGAIANLTAYIANTSRGNVINTEVPNDKAALAAYEKGKKQFYMKRGQLNLSCSDCHITNSGGYARSELLSPALGNLSHFPVYRHKWQELGTPHRRFGGCNKNIRAKPFKAQSDEYKSLEYFLMVMSKGIETNGPSSRK
ncbi:MAG: sulfur oxidation c-type cytochrome SoxA [Gammaproteobacteria bacterium]|nr:sulfur oxidation c-type cytochrome SoxA [Gammaproteobacteria bacterium]